MFHRGRQHGVSLGSFRDNISGMQEVKERAKGAVFRYLEKQKNGLKTPTHRHTYTNNTHTHTYNTHNKHTHTTHIHTHHTHIHTYTLTYTYIQPDVIYIDMQLPEILLAA